MALDLHAPDFTTQDLLTCVPGLSTNLLGQWMHRGVITLEGGRQGRARRVTAQDIFFVATIHAMSRQALPPSKAHMVWLVVRQRLLALMSGDPTVPQGMASVLALHPETGELVIRNFYEGDDSEDPAGFENPDCPDMVTIFFMDRFLQRVAARIEAVRQRKPAPAEPHPTRGQDPDPMRMGDVDAEGRGVMVGLTFEESEELHALLHRDRSQYPTYAAREAASERFNELYERHERARSARSNAEVDARNRAEDAEA